MNQLEMENIAMQYRGKIINDTVELERVIDCYLAQYFCPDSEKQDDLILGILSNERISLSSKIQVLDMLSKSNKINLYGEYKTMKSDLTSIIEERNILAHYFLDLSPNSNNLTTGIIKFHKLKNKLESIEYSKNRFDELCLKIKNLTAFMIQKIV